MEELVLLQRMNRGRCPEGGSPENSEHCLFYGPIEEPVARQRIFSDGENLVMELTYGGESMPGELRLRQSGSNLVIEESPQGLFRDYLEGRAVKYMGHGLMYALQFRIQDLSSLVEQGVEDMKKMEDTLDRNIDNSGTYQILDFRRRYTEYGNQVIGVKEILARINKGYFPMQMENSYALQGQVELDFQFLEERYELIKNTVIKDLDTYTSIVNNNINRNARLLSIVSLGAVALNLMFGGIIALNPALGIVGGVAVVGLTAGAAASYKSGGMHAIEVGRRGRLPLKGRGFRRAAKELTRPPEEAVPVREAPAQVVPAREAEPEEAFVKAAQSEGAMAREAPPEEAEATAAAEGEAPPEETEALAAAEGEAPPEEIKASTAPEGEAPVEAALTEEPPVGPEPIPEEEPNSRPRAAKKAKDEEYIIL